MASDADRVERAKDALRALLNAQLAMVQPEVFARLGETYHAGDPRNFDQHIAAQALTALERAGELITATAAPTKGGRAISTLQPANRRLRTTAIDKAARRKRVLYARYMGWAHSTKRYPEGLIGPAGERAARGGIMQSTAILATEPHAGPVSTMLGVRLPGPADSGGIIVPLAGGVPQPPVTVLIEVKSIREWIYPSNSELFQVLHKCVVLKQAHPTVPIVPILVCRRAHKTPSGWRPSSASS